LNLAQAVLICAYELFLAGGATAIDAHSSSSTAGESAARARATSERLELMYGHLETALRAIGYLQRDNAEHMMRSIRRVLGRAALDDHDVQIFLGLARQISWAGSR
jgi:tRNA/rRNA methyltransferase